MRRFHTRLVVVFFLGLCASPTIAQLAEVVPQPATADQPLTVRAQLPYMICFYDIVSADIERTDNGVSIVYEVETPEGYICPTIMPPVILEERIGSFPAGDYTATVTGGEVDGELNPPIEISFSVGVTRVIPALLGPGLLILALGLALVAAGRLVSGQTRSGV